MTLGEFNCVPADEARLVLAKCCGSMEWVDRMLGKRPFEKLDQLIVAADEAWWALDESAWLDAFSKHPQIGARYRVSAWSSEEQAGMKRATQATTSAMERLNREYFERFGYIFITCATGKSGDDMLAEIERRLNHDPAQEIQIAAAEQAKIIRIRLQKQFEA